jgi:glycosyltransferase involved in cell wall biosynthesis
MSCDQRVSVVMATYNRGELAASKARLLLADPVVAQVVVVVDGSTDDTADRLAAIDDGRLTVVAHAVNRGLPAARNSGIAAATQDWVLLTDDDDELSPTFLVTTLDVATRSGADIVGAPWVRGGVRPTTHGMPSIFSGRSLVPQDEWTETPFVSSNALARRSVLAAIPFDPGYCVNAWCEETDVFVRAIRAGHRVVLARDAWSTTPLLMAPGGIDKANRLRYERAVAMNTARFLRRHGRFLRSHGLIRSPLVELCSLVVARWWALLRGGLRARWSARPSSRTATLA